MENLFDLAELSVKKQPTRLADGRFCTPSQKEVDRKYQQVNSMQKRINNLSFLLDVEKRKNIALVKDKSNERMNGTIEGAYLAGFEPSKANLSDRELYTEATEYLIKSITK